MAVRTIALIGALSALLAGGAIAAERSAKPATPAESLPVATDVRLGGDDKQTRLVIDLPQVTFKLPTAS